MDTLLGKHLHLADIFLNPLIYVIKKFYCNRVGKCKFECEFEFGYDLIQEYQYDNDFQGDLEWQ